MSNGPRAGRRVLPFILAIIAAAIVAIVVLRPQDLAPDALLLDQFDRTVSDGWGEDPHAGRYAVSGTRADYGVASGAATIVVPEAGFTRSALLSGVNERDVELAFRVSMDTPSTEAGSYIYGIMRHADPEHEYRAKIRLSPDGGVYVAVTALVKAKERELSPETRIPDLKYAVGTGLDVRARVDGEPATIRVKVWPEGTTEPAAWTVRSNAPAALLPKPGTIGVQVYVSKTSTALPVTFTFGSFNARRLIAPAASGRSARPTATTSGVDAPSP